MVNEEHRGKMDADLYKQRWDMMDKDRHSSSFSTSDHAGVHAQEEVAESGKCAEGPSIPSLGPWGLKQLPTSVASSSS